MSALAEQDRSSPVASARRPSATFRSRIRRAASPMSTLCLPLMS